ncbi:hypothetical protein A2U01_0096336, partial [Trifolium medium]|nr:hypothetical protein [Trifolium medium]
MLDHPLELASCSASKIATASLSNVVRLYVQKFVPAVINAPSELRTHQLQP